MHRLGATVLLLLTSTLRLHAEDLKLGSCDASGGAWEFTSEEGGRAVIARDGDKYHVIWVTTFVNTGGTTEPEGIAADCSCHDAPNKLVWNCSVAFSFQPGQVGTQQTYEWTVDGNTLKSWYIAPDGKRSATGMRRPR